MTRDPEVLNAQQTADFLGVHVETVRRLARRGDLPSLKVGKDWRFRKGALLRWSEDQERGGSRYSVLVVDDEEPICRAMTKILERFGCRVRQATDGRMGLQLVRHETPDVILLDLLMPDMNGPQFLAELRTTHADLPVVVVTGYPDGELMLEAARHPPVMVLPKPVNGELLERALRVALGKRAAARDT
jgi:excisionase family DNA binding protein